MAKTSTNTTHIEENAMSMEVFCGIDWAEDVRHEVAWCE
jgi:hypothetical protein